MNNINIQEIRNILWEKTQKQQAVTLRKQESGCAQDCMQKHTHGEKEVFYGKKLAAGFQGFTLSEALQPIHPQERRNKEKRNILGPEEVQQLQDARRALREMQPAA